MVGVPHSTGCARCRERRIKCDEAIPDCTQCRRYGRPCPGYRRTFRFQDERPALERRHQSSSNRPSPTTPQQRTLPDAAALTMIQAHIARDDPHIHPSGSGAVFTQQQQQHQQPQLFAEEMRTSLPALSFQLRCRRAGNGPDCAAYIASSFGQSAAQDGAVTCVTAMVRASRTHDRGLMKTARQAYAATLQQVALALQCTNTSEGTRSEGARGADMLAAVMMLTVYEMYAQTSRDAWVVHADGVRRLMGSRGASAHGTGWARACYLAFRGLLVAAAVQEGTACFLAGDEWQDLARRVRAEDVRRGGEWAGFVCAADRAFMEIVLCPGFLAEARSVQEVSALRELVARVRVSRGRLVRVATELRVSVQACEGVVGAALVLQGVESAVDLLDGLLERLRENEVRPFRVVSALGRCLAAPSGARDVTALDRVASSMGMLGTVLVIPERYR
ncbi:hypothetical protein BJX96DRAFT_175297 [Aspergillus floccosus]